MKPQIKRLLMLSLCLLCFGISSYGQGIKWAEGLSWAQIKARAKTENKYIFVDCYATWCSPCKQMDKDVYPLEAVGNAMNDKFIAVKLQMDSTKNDVDNIKQYYAAAQSFKNKYSIEGFPTYIFFSPDGECVHKAMGFQKAEKFIQLIKDAQIPETQLYTQLKACRDGKMDVNLVPVFIRLLNDGRDKTIALELARSYMKNYLEGLDEAKFSAKRNLQFMWDFQEMLNSDDRIYKLLCDKPGIVNHIYDNPTLANLWIENILKTEYIFPAIKSAEKASKEPNWNYINATLIKKTETKRAENMLIDAKHLWYCMIKNWDKACDYEMIRFKRKDLKKLPQDQMCAELNTISWTLFTYCFNKKQLEQGLVWINEAMALDERNHKTDVARMDTKANLLYKLGRKAEAIVLQEKALALSSASVWYIDINTALEKMKTGKPTWPTEQIGVDEQKQVK